MASQLYNIKIKNTFVEVDVDEDSFSDINFDEDDGAKRQVSEPSPSTSGLFDIPRLSNSRKANSFLENATALSIDFSEAIDESTLEESTASSEHDSKASEPFQPECEPELTYCGNGMVRQATEELTEELCLNVWSGMQWEPDIEQSCLSPHLSHTVTGQCILDPYLHAMPAAALMGLGTAAEHESYDRSTSKRMGNDSGAHSKSKTAQRRKRESLIDIAARRQKQESRRTKQQQKKQGSQEQLGQTASHTQGDMPKAKLVKSCPQCGAQCQVDYKFCRFCGAAV